MPEEINRIVTDHISELLFTTESSGNENLLKEGIAEEKIFFVGNCMIDSLYKHVASATAAQPWKTFNLDPESYALLTLHRPSNVDSAEQLKNLMDTINKMSEMLPVLFPVHPRTRKNLTSWNIPISDTILISDPLPYLAFLGCMAKARLVLTDSGGIQEETTSLEIPCLTLRHNTERPSTTAFGTNRLVGTSEQVILCSAKEVLSGSWPKGQKPPLWDGHAAIRVVDVLKEWMNDAPRA
jgi:UDP-N-acetylglucosamine 2-epimerase (non-hydrolysing)